jgi:serine/threonine protein kinase
LPTPGLCIDSYHQFQGAVSGLKHLHNHDPPIIHGDIHPDNLLLDDNGVIFLTDFGLCRIKHEQSRQTNAHTCGKLRYAAPELEMGVARSRTNQASDIYSLAMTFFALASIDHPFSDIEVAHEAASAARRGQRPSKPEEMRLLNARQTECFWPLLEKMWSQEPDNRLSVVQVEYELRTSITPILQRETFRERVMSTAGARPIKKIDQPKMANPNMKVDSKPGEPTCLEQKPLQPVRQLHTTAQNETRANATHVRRRNDSLLDLAMGSVKRLTEKIADGRRKQPDLEIGPPPDASSQVAPNQPPGMCGTSAQLSLSL